MSDAHGIFFVWDVGEEGSNHPAFDEMTLLPGSAAFALGSGCVSEPLVILYEIAVSRPFGHQAVENGVG